MHRRLALLTAVALAASLPFGALARGGDGHDKGGDHGGGGHHGGHERLVTFDARASRGTAGGMIEIGVRAEGRGRIEFAATARVEFEAAPVEAPLRHHGRIAKGRVSVPADQPTGGLDITVTVTWAGGQQVLVADTRIVGGRGGRGGHETSHVVRGGEAAPGEVLSVQARIRVGHRWIDDFSAVGVLHLASGDVPLAFTVRHGKGTAWAQVPADEPPGEVALEVTFDHAGVLTTVPGSAGIVPGEDPGDPSPEPSDAPDPSASPEG